MIKSVLMSGRQRLNEVLQGRAGKVKEMTEAIKITRDSIVQVLRHELQEGRFHEVLAVLKGHMQAAPGQHLILNHIKDLVVHKLMMRLGLRKVMAVGIAAILIPLVLAKIAQFALKDGRLINLFQALDLQERFSAVSAVKEGLKRKFGLKPKEHHLSFY